MIPKSETEFYSIGMLKEDMPEIFDDRIVPDDLVEDWFFAPSEDIDINADILVDIYSSGFLKDDVRVPDFSDAGRFGGAPIIPRDTSPSPTPPIDTLAFYLPFHFYYSEWWGIYILLDGIAQLTAELKLRQISLDNNELYKIAKLFLRGHEEYHHYVEVFGTRLEIIERKPVYKNSIVSLYAKQFNSDDCLEEALANAHAWQLLKSKIKGIPKDTKKAVLNSFTDIISQSPPGYRKGANYRNPNDFEFQRTVLSEEIVSSIHARSVRYHAWYDLPNLITSFSAPFEKVLPPLTILVHKNSPLISALEIDKKHFRYRDLRKRLEKTANCRFIRSEGGHEIWEAPNGHRFPIPKHPQDLSKGLIKAIINEAGLDISVSEFIQLSR